MSAYNGHAMLQEIESEARCYWSALHDARRRSQPQDPQDYFMTEWERGRAVELATFLRFLLWLRRVGLGQGRD